MVDVTIVVTPWQHFSDTALVLENILAYTTPPYALVYVDANSPPRVQAYLQRQAAKHGFTLLRRDRYLTSNEARNLAMPYVNTKYVAFVGSSTLVTPGWLESLVRCAQETGAWAVEPIYCIGSMENPTVYSFAPELRIIEDAGGRRLHETSPLLRTPLADVRSTLKRTPAGYAKFECALVRADAIAGVHGFDERYTWFQDARDFSLAIQQAGGSIYSEPEAIVLVLDPRLTWSDLPLYFLRWSDAWLEPSAQHFSRMWNVSIDDDGLRGNARFRDVQRRKLFSKVRKLAGYCGGWRGVRLVDSLIDSFFQHVIEPTFVARLQRARERVL